MQPLRAENLVAAYKPTIPSANEVAARSASIASFDKKKLRSGNV